MAKRRTSRRGKKKTYNFKCTVKENMCGDNSGGCFYFLGFLGALIYYITTAPTFWDAVIGFLKAIVWPASLFMEQWWHWHYRRIETLILYFCLFLTREQFKHIFEKSI